MAVVEDIADSVGRASEDAFLMPFFDGYASVYDASGLPQHLRDHSDASVLYPRLQQLKEVALCPRLLDTEHVHAVYDWNLTHPVEMTSDR